MTNRRIRSISTIYLHEHGISKYSYSCRFVPNVRYISTSDRNRKELMEALNIIEYKEEEIKASFRLLKLHEGVSSIDNERMNLSKGLKELVGDKKALILAQELLGKHNLNSLLTYEEYCNKIKDLGQRLDARVYPLAFAFLATGVSVGVVIPAMPMLVHQLDISPQYFGLVVAAFGLSRLLGNLPAGQLVEKFGRKPVLLSGLSICGIGLSGISLTFSLGEANLLLCRFISGLGVAAFASAGHTIIADISTPLNRTRTVAPIMAAFSAGTAVGPALGGLLIPAVGLPMTYLAAGASFAGIAGLCHFTIEESKTANVINSSKEMTSSDTRAQSHTMSIKHPNSIKEALSNWKSLLVTNAGLKNAVIFSGWTWVGLAGSQFTLLPLHMASPLLGLGAPEIGICFTASACVSFLAAQPVAMLADKIGKEKMMIVGGTLATTAALCLPHSTSLFGMLLLALPMSLGSSCINSIPPALMADLVPSHLRSQALSLLRTSGDMGLLFGSSIAGLIAANASLEIAANVNALMVGASTILYCWVTKGGQSSKL